jgi:hypothetical protein
VAEIFVVNHLTGVPQGTPTYSSFDTAVPLASNLVQLPACSFAQFSVQRTDALPTPTPQPAISLLSAITGTSGSASPQTVTVSTTAFMTTILPQGGVISSSSGAQFWIIDPGTSSQEVIEVRSILSSTTFTAVCMQNHSVGATLIACSSFVTKFLDLQIGGITDVNGVGEITLIRYGPLPYGVYEQYLLRGSVGTFSYVADVASQPWYSGGVEATGSTPIPTMPQFSDSSVDAYGIPTNGITINAGPFTDAVSWRVTPSPQLQFLFTTWPESDLSPIVYRVYWRDL